MTERLSRILLAAALAALAALAACGPAAAPLPATAPAEIAVAPAAPAPAPEPEEPPEKSPGRPQPPPGYIEVSVVGVLPTSNGGAAVLLGPDGPRDRRLVVPIYIGGTEAVSITMRVNEERPERPLTHDLLDAVMRELGGELVKVQVDEVRSGVFIGSIFVRREGRLIEIDSRSSDAIALAVGNKVPIFMAKEVLEQAGEESPEAPAP